ncbi:LysM domain-containing protein [Thiobacillus sp.]|uniref:LysM peptidoglycan-binding domain-containing protein n=1 Tax=Thiobacillus sp. TaxID=924 RepID=UPI0025D6F150|nr:LysM domain-containing protein [Thiobacillus sp.]MBT9541280.1 LysM peptidoglycan-binding domain-containing protein [Thiobacillus sp.]
MKTTGLACAYRCRYLVLALSLGAANAAWAQTNIPITPPADDGGILLWRVVPADLHNPKFSAETFKALVTKSLPRSVQVKVNDTLSDVVRRHFNVSRTWTPAVYGALVEQIKQANNLVKDTDLKPGTLIVPDLPRTAKSQPSAFNVLNVSPKISMLDLGANAWDSSKNALVGTPVVSELGRVGSQSVMQIRRLPLEVALSFAAPLDEDVPSEFRFAAMRVPLTVELSAEPAPAPVGDGCPAIDPALASILASKPRTQATVVVLDDAWPDDEEFMKARDFVINASKLIRAKFKLDGATPTLGDIDALSKMKGTSFPAGIAPYPALRTHAAAIKASLRSLSCNDKGQGVKVVFIPMGTAQDGSYPLLREILYLAYLARIKSNNFSTQLVWAAPQKDQIDTARSFAAKGFADEKGKISPFLNPFSPTGPNNILTDQALIEQLAFFLRMHSDASQSPHFLSMSWTARELAWQIYFPEYSYGLMLAAAGNRETVNVHEKRVQFAYRSTNPGDVIAVENSDGAKYLCSSSHFSQAEGVDVLGVGYPGEISETKFCGTSFSTPRVAWLLAAREAYIAPPPVTDEERSLWQSRQKTRIKAMRALTQKGSMRFNVTWQKLLEAPAN